MIKTFVEATVDSPKVMIDEEIGFVEISGNSTMEDPYSFYQHLIDYFAGIIKANNNTGFTINFRLEYFNTSSSKWIFQFLKILEKEFKEGLKIEVNWHYDEDDEVMMEAGEDFKSLMKMPFNIVEQ